MTNYYTNKLSSEKLMKCYELATPRVNRYLEAELGFALSHISKNSKVLDLGCGYGRTLPALAAKSKSVTGIDISDANIKLAKKLLRRVPNCDLEKMNARNLRFRLHTFDVTLCIQNGISAFKVNQKKLIRESIRVTKPGGIVLFSTYSEKFWKHRLKWFVLQSKTGLLGDLDMNKTRNGTIICKDGFKATTLTKSDFLSLTSDIKNIKVSFKEINCSSLFCFIKIMPNSGKQKA